MTFSLTIFIPFSVIYHRFFTDFLTINSISLYHATNLGYTWRSLCYQQVSHLASGRKEVACSSEGEEGRQASGSPSRRACLSRPPWSLCRAEACWVGHQRSLQSHCWPASRHTPDWCPPLTCWWPAALHGGVVVGWGQGGCARGWPAGKVWCVTHKGLK